METTAKSPKDTLIEHLKPLTGERKGGWAAIAREAIDRLKKEDFPSRKSEKYKYTRTGKIARNLWTPQQPEEPFRIDPAKLPIDNACNIFLVNGRLQGGIQGAPEGVTITPLNEIESPAVPLRSTEEDIFDSLNDAMWTDGIHIAIDRNKKADKPVQIVVVSHGRDVLAQPRIVIEANESSELDIVLTGTSEGSSKVFTNLRMEVRQEKNSKVNLDQIQLTGEEDFYLTNQVVHQERDSFFSETVLSLTGGWIRNNINVSVDGENCQTDLYGAFVLNSTQHVDNHTIIDHRKPNCESNELFKGVVDDQSTAVFNGKVYVRQDAQKINAFQSNGNIILNDDANINSKPELEIYADDVKCSHGSTTGQLDDQALFYLRSRGISKTKAERMLVAAFVAEVFEHINNDQVREFALEVMAQRHGWEF